MSETVFGLSWFFGVLLVLGMAFEAVLNEEDSFFPRTARRLFKKPKPPILPREMRGMSADQIAELYTPESIKAVAEALGAVKVLSAYGQTKTWTADHPDVDLLATALTIRTASEALDASTETGGAS